MQQIIKRVPIPTAGVALGLAALGNLLSPIDEILRLVCGTLSVLLVVLLLAKTAMFPKMIKADFENPVFASVSATLAMALMQLSGYVANISMKVACGIWITALAGHIVLIIWFSLRHVRKFQLDQVFPTYFVCYVGIIVASVTSPIFGFEAFGQIIFWIGFLFYIPLLAIITVRCIKHPMPDQARPLLCIYSAPASLSIVGYLSVVPNPSPLFVAILLICGQMFFVLVVAKLPRLLATGFFPSYAAMTFPFVITATALVQSVGFFGFSSLQFYGIFEMIMTAEVAFAAAMVLFVLAKYIQFLFAPALEDKLADKSEQESKATAVEQGWARPSEAE